MTGIALKASIGAYFLISIMVAPRCIKEKDEKIKLKFE